MHPLWTNPSGVAVKTMDRSIRLTTDESSFVDSNSDQYVGRITKRL